MLKSFGFSLCALFMACGTASAYEKHISYADMQVEIGKKLPKSFPVGTIEHISIVPGGDTLHLDVRGSLAYGHKPWEMQIQSMLAYNPDKGTFYLTDVREASLDGLSHHAHIDDTLPFIHAHNWLKPLANTTLEHMPVYRVDDSLKGRLVKHVVKSITFTQSGADVDLELF